MWCLMDLDDSLRLSQSELEQGIATITQSQPFFDCYPAISCAFDYTRNFANKRREMEEDLENYWQEEPEEDSLKYEDFWMFISVLKQYYRFCQVCETNVVVILFSFFSFLTFNLRFSS